MKGAGYGGIDIDVCPNCLKKKGFIVEAKDTKEEEAIGRENEPVKP